MITTITDLKRVITLEKNYYLKGKALSAWVVRSKDYSIFQFQKYLRKEEFYGNQSRGLANRILYIWYKRKKNVLGQRLGFDIPSNCFEEGLRIHHVGPITVNSSARIGKNCEIAGNVCIGGSYGGAPTIGSDCYLGYGCVVIGNITLADCTIVGAGAVVTKSCMKKCKLVGVPAKAIAE